MRREAFKMYLKPGCEEEYIRRHNLIWPELKQLLSDSGVSDYSIFWTANRMFVSRSQKME